MAQNDTLKSVRNSLLILKKFSNKQSTVYVSQLADELGLAKSTISRLVRTLESEGFLSKDRQSNGYKLGPEVLTLGGIMTSNNILYTEVSPVLNDVVQQTQEAGQIAIWEDGYIFYINKLVGPYYSNISTQLGSRNPFHATSNGKVLLAYQSEEKIEEFVYQPHEAFTEYTITNPIHLYNEIKKVRAQGYCYSKEELTRGNYSLAYPVFNYEDMNVCSISISGPLARLNDARLKEYKRILKEAAREASDRLGFDGKYPLL